MRIRYRAQALSDIDAIDRYLKEKSPSAARKVLRAVYAGIHLIGEQPYASPQTDDPKVRVKVMRRYRFKIFYQIVGDDTVEILHVRHASRQPWQSKTR